MARKFFDFLQLGKRKPPPINFLLSETPTSEAFWNKVSKKRAEMLLEAKSLDVNKLLGESTAEWRGRDLKENAKVYSEEHGLIFEGNLYLPHNVGSVHHACLQEIANALKSPVHVVESSITPKTLDSLRIAAVHTVQPRFRKQGTR